ncbi:MAG: class I SAM-dependent methyltransferase [Bacteroidetes bacterium]|nr:class I SAM-dependent methyltransferase [Bacteroidota bacterium]
MAIDIINDKKALDSMNAETYKDNSEIQYYTSTNLLNAYSFKGNEKVLDIGCGDGKITNYIKRKIPKGEILGIDPSKSMIQLANSLFENEDNLNFKENSAEDYLGENVYDLIVGFNSFHWIKNKNQAFENIYRALKPKGKLLTLIEPRDCELWTITEEVLLEGYKNILLNTMYPYCWLNEDYQRTFLGLGLKKIYSCNFEEIIFVNKSRIYDFLDPITNCFLRASENIYRKFLIDLQNKMEEKYSLDTNSIAVPCKMIAYYYEK